MISAYNQQHTAVSAFNTAARNSPVLAVANIRQGKKIRQLVSSDNANRYKLDKAVLHFYLAKGLVYRKKNYNAAFEGIFVSPSKTALELVQNKSP